MTPRSEHGRGRVLARGCSVKEAEADCTYRAINVSVHGSGGNLEIRIRCAVRVLGDRVRA